MKRLKSIDSNSSPLSVPSHQNTQTTTRTTNEWKIISDLDAHISTTSQNGVTYEKVPATDLQNHVAVFLTW